MTLVPAQIVLPVLAVILTAGATVDVTDIVIPEDVAVAGLAQVIEEVITTVTTAPFVSELVE